METAPVYELETPTSRRQPVTSVSRFRRQVSGCILLVHVAAPGTKPVLVETTRREGERLVRTWLGAGLRVVLDVHDIRLVRPDHPSALCGHLYALH